MEYATIRLFALIPESKKKCAQCKRKLTPEITDIHHKNGKRYDNRPENLELICQQCHRGHTVPRRLPSVLITFRLSQTLLETINDEAEEKKTNTSAIIRKALEEKFGVT